MHIPYKEFMMTNSYYKTHNSFDDFQRIRHGHDKESFREVYEAYFLEEDVEIYKYDHPGYCVFGFVIIDGNIREWHTVREAVWETYNNFLKEMNGE